MIQMYIDFEDLSDKPRQNSFCNVCELIGIVQWLKSLGCPKTHGSSMQAVVAS